MGMELILDQIEIAHFPQTFQTFFEHGLFILASGFCICPGAQPSKLLCQHQMLQSNCYILRFPCPMESAMLLIFCCWYCQFGLVTDDKLVL